MLIAIVPKALGPLVYGEFVYLQDFFMKLFGFLDMGSSLAFFTKLSARHARKELILFYFLYSMLVLFLVVVFIYIVVTYGDADMLLPNIPKEYIFMGLFFGFFTWFTQIFIKISDAYALTVSVELIKISHKIGSLLLLLYFVYFTAFDLDSYFYFQYIALISFVIIVSLLFVKKGIFKNIFNFQFSIKNLSKEFIEYCHPLIIMNIIILISGLFDIWLLQKISGSKQTGYYGIAYSLATMCFLFTSAMTPIIIREFSKSYEEKDLEKMKKIFYKYVPMLYSIAAYFAIFISFQSENVLMIFTDEKFKDAYPVLVVMALYPIHQTYGQLSGSIFYATGQTKLMRNISLFITSLGILVTYIFVFIFKLGAEGLAYKMIIIQLLGVNIQLYFNARFLKLNMKYFIFHQLYALLFFILLAFFSSILIKLNSPIWDFLFSGFVYTFFVIIFAYVLPQIFAIQREVLVYYISKIYLRR